MKLSVLLTSDNVIGLAVAAGGDLVMENYPTVDALVARVTELIADETRKRSIVRGQGLSFAIEFKSPLAGW